MKIKEYLELISEANHLAGGGSVAALNGATACALIQKAYNMIHNKHKDFYYKIGLNAYDELERMKNFFNVTIKADGESFQKVIEAYKLPSDTDEEYQVRKIAIQEAYKLAFQSSYEMISHIVKLFDYIFRGDFYSLPMANLELEIAKAQMVACYKSARATLKINLSYIDDNEFVEKANSNLSKLDQSFVYSAKKFDHLFAKK